MSSNRKRSAGPGWWARQSNGSISAVDAVAAAAAGGAPPGGTTGGARGDCYLDVSLTVKEWKKAYFGDRPPRLAIKLVNPPPSCKSLRLRAFTSFIGDVPVITTKKKTIRCERKSNELKVKQMANETTNCMQSWTYCAAITGRELISGKTGQTVFRCKINKYVENWLTAIKNPEATRDGPVNIKPDDAKMFMSQAGGVLTVRKAGDSGVEGVCVCVCA